MAGLMVFVMTAYNVTLAQGFSNGLVMASLVATHSVYSLPSFLDLAGRGTSVALAFKYIINDYMRKRVVLIGITISVLMVLGMVTCMSLFGIAVEGELSGSHVLATYGHTWIFDLIVALPLQLIIVGPIARGVLGKMQRATANTESAAAMNEED